MNNIINFNRIYYDLVIVKHGKRENESNPENLKMKYKFERAVGELMKVSFVRYNNFKWNDN